MPKHKIPMKKRVVYEASEEILRDTYIRLGIITYPNKFTPETLEVDILNRVYADYRIFLDEMFRQCDEHPYNEIYARLRDYLEYHVRLINTIHRIG